MRHEKQFAQKVLKAQYFDRENKNLPFNVVLYANFLLFEYENVNLSI